MEVNCQLHALAALTPGNNSGTQWIGSSKFGRYGWKRVLWRWRL